MRRHSSFDSRDQKDQRFSISHILNPIDERKSSALADAAAECGETPALSPPPRSLPPAHDLDLDVAATDEAVHKVYTCVTHQQSRAILGYGVYFGENSANNVFGCCLGDKSVYRSELRAILHALNKITSITTGDNAPEPSKWVVYTCHEYSVKRVAGPGSRESGEVSHTRGAPCMDLVLHIRSLTMWLEQRGLYVQIKHVSPSNPCTRHALELAKQSVETRNIEQPVLTYPQLISSRPAGQVQSVYTDGSTFLRDGETIAGYGVYFGTYDIRNECGPVLGKGTGPRASLAAILRAIIKISTSNFGHKDWEVVSCRGQYVTSIFELSSHWQKHGWKRNAGKSIASLDIYREARRLLDELQERGFDIKGRYIPQKTHNHGLMVADVMARHGAGDASIELPLDPSGSFDVPTPAEDTVPTVVYTYAKSDLGTDKARITRWEINFGPESNRNTGGWFALSKKSLTACAIHAVVVVLRLIELKEVRRWHIYTNNEDALRLILDFVKGKRKRHAPSDLESIATHIQRLERHGYQLTFDLDDEGKELSEIESTDNSPIVSPTEGAPIPGP